ncbi:nucleotide sugar dehydrogenase [Xanthobacter sp. 126]|uniref:nucleotide sugar dehydrogenase n=1 Tax=Xanthobacter sp. 126 TaxID=1131814 RepID=UPI00045EAC15|nr:nucleotide sugar dehydrogenase [Xanthobacter sp. 126]
MNIAIYGLGYVGLTAAGCLTHSGHRVLGVDVSANKVEAINAGKTPISEPGLDKLIADAVSSGQLSAVQSIQGGLKDFDMAIVCVGTPSAPDGSHNMGYIAEVSRQIAHALGAAGPRATPLTVVYRSTVRPGTIEELVLPIFAAVLEQPGAYVELVYNPEFLRESIAIKDFFAPPKIVIGTADGQPSANMEKLNGGLNAPTFYTGFREAEFTKFVDNTFHALKVSYANEIGRLCLDLGIQASKVHEIFVSDTKLNISPYYLRPGGAFGGSCLPKDVRALQYIAADIGVAVPVIDNVIRSNDAHKHYLFSYASEGLAKGAKVLMVGLAFKADTDDLRESPNLDLARKLLQAGFKLSIWDDTLEPAKLVGQNLGYGFTHLPSMDALLVSKDEAEAGSYDRVIDTNGRAGSLALTSSSVISLDHLP